MFLIIVFIFQVALLIIGNLLFPISDMDLYSWFFIFINFFFVSFYLLAINKSRYNLLILLGFILRILALIADYYGWFNFISSGGDTEWFHETALKNQILTVKSKATNYTDFLSIIYWLTGSSRIIAQYINVLLSVGTLLIIQKTIFYIQSPDYVRRFVMLIICFMPLFITHSAILLREAWIHFFISLSIFSFVHWFYTGRLKDAIATIIYVLMAMYMHSGAIGLLSGYIIAFSVYRPRLAINRISIFSILCFGAAIIGIFLLFQTNMFTAKFAAIESSEDLIANLNRDARGDSAYLQWLQASSLWQGLLFAPLKMFYFMFSPLPMNWRMSNDVIAFLFDSSIYIVCVIAILKNRKKIRIGRRKRLYNYMIISLITTIFVFSYGTYNSGTAIRHRMKLLPLILVIFTVSYEPSTRS